MSERTYNIILVILVVVACVVTGALLYLIYSTTIAPAPTPTPTQEVTAPVLPEDAWSRIQAEGKIVAGTSADYPPFAFWTPEYQLDGLDVVLISEIGRVLGLNVELKDMAFDGLNWALELNQIDVAIAALSITPGRSQELDFSDVYFVSEDAILARADSSIPPISRVTELTGYRIGVQRASVYSNWIYESLVDSGLMPASQLLEYEQIELAVRDLREDRVDVVILDFPVAQVATAQGGVKLVGQGINTQYFAIGIPQGEDELRTQINRALRELYDSGRLAEITQQYTGVTPPLPQPPPTPDPGTPTAPLPTSTPATCVDGMRFVSDLNLADNGMQNPPVVTPGQAFRKGWRVQNTGTCTWNSSYQFTFDGGNSAASSMGSQSTPIVGTVAPGAQYDVYVELIAPVVPGVYQGFWVLRNRQDQKFGDRIWVGITVPNPPTLTPPPTQTPSPGIAYTVDRNRIFAGQCVTFNWVVSGSQAVYFYPDGQPWQQNQVANQGSREECPPLTTNYNLRVVKPDNSVEIRQITVFVEQVPGAPLIERFTVDPANQIVVGQCVDIIWSVTGNVNRVDLTRGDEEIWPGGAPISGTVQDCPSETGQAVYVLEATGPGGTSRLQRIVNVQGGPTAVVTSTSSPPQVTPSTTPAPVTPTSVPPIIYSFSAEPSQLQAGECTIVSWQVGGGTAKIDVLRNGVLIAPNVPFGGRFQQCLNSSGSYVYRLQVLGLSGQSDFRDVTVAVSDTPTQQPTEQPTQQPTEQPTDQPTQQPTESATQVTPPVTPPSLQGTAWELQRYLDSTGTLQPILEDSLVSAVFDPSAELSGSGGCNSYTANYTANSSSLSIGEPVAANVLCTTPPGVMEQESSFLLLLPTASFYEIDSGILTITDVNGRAVLEFVVDQG